ncbi:MAG: dephospho-CoA kinase [Stutzerimonas stutzeri]|nr:MAG: dephospho-CoA kinase [Stutzerimonas stutzeri]
MTYLLGLTGSIGMGKSTTSAMFRAAGVPVHDADQAVHDLYAGAAAPQIEAAFPGTTTNGVVDRARLSAAVLGRPEALTKLEAIIHPLVRAKEQAFLAEARRSGATVAVLDIPLLLETGAEGRYDAVVVVTAPAEVQRKRVLGRPGMTEEKFAAILARQMPDAEKRRRAHFLVDTSHGLMAAERQVRSILNAVAGRFGRSQRAG